MRIQCLDWCILHRKNFNYLKHKVSYVNECFSLKRWKLPLIVALDVVENLKRVSIFENPFTG